MSKLYPVKRTIKVDNVGLGVAFSVLVVAVIGAALSFPFAVAWVADIVYSGIFETPGSRAPDIGYWYWVGIVYLFLFVTGRFGANTLFVTGRFGINNKGSK